MGINFLNKQTALLQLGQHNFCTHCSHERLMIMTMYLKTYFNFHIHNTSDWKLSDNKLP